MGERPDQHRPPFAWANLLLLDWLDGVFIPCFNPSGLRPPAPAATAMRWLPGHRIGGGGALNKRKRRATENP
jgi:hypothetical protein